MRGINIAEQCHVVNLLPPHDADTVATPEVFSMRTYGHASIILQAGVTGAATTVTVEAADNFTPSNVEAIAFAVYKEETAAGDTLGDRVEVTSAGFATSTNDGVMYIIEIDAAALPEGKPNLQVKVSDPAAATFVSAVAILSGGRYTGNESATVIA